MSGNLKKKKDAKMVSKMGFNLLESLRIITLTALEPAISHAFIFMNYKIAGHSDP